MRMIRACAFLFFFVAHLSTACQLKAQDIWRQQKVIGSQLLAGVDIYADVFTFPERVDHCYYDAKGQLLSTLLRPTDGRGRLRRDGHIAVYDLKRSEGIWAKKIQFIGSRIFQPEGYLLESQGAYTTVSRIADGNKLWRRRYNTYFVNELFRLAMAYDKRDARHRARLQGLDMLTGISLWNREIPLTHGWNDLQQVNDSTYLVLASGLHLVNVKSGEGWSYFTKTGERSTGNVVSNILEESGDYYMASQGKLARIDARNGRVKWSSSYPEELASASSLFSNDTAIFMVNTGLAESWMGPKTYGKPFIAAYRKSTGHPYYFVQVEDGDAPILDHAVTEHHVLLLRAGKLEAYAKKDGARSAFKSYSPQEDGYPIQFLPGEEVFTKRPDGRYTKLAAIDSLSRFVLFSSGIVEALNHKLERVYYVDIDGIWLHNHTAEALLLLSDGERTMVVNEDGVAIAELIAPAGELQSDHKLLYHAGDQCYMIDLAPLVASAGE